MKLADEIYLGDGLYCALMSGMIALRAPREDGDHTVFLEPETYEALRKFALRIGWELPLEEETE